MTLTQILQIGEFFLSLAIHLSACRVERLKHVTSKNELTREAFISFGGELYFYD